ncbi:hypothetical protein HPB49_023195 [Dermacentor silvarum]|uniref:Uncharacterized protein n=1 Tax=Dermacentor silvarum TaxID=543639 RepID=A0ACB8CI50_DERSI|nr:hypothetical protein HPB49_023195 [Dermacentor silvarum]
MKLPFNTPPRVGVQVDRGRTDNPSKKRTAGSGHPKDRGQQKSTHKKEKTITQITHMIHRITNRKRGLRERDVLRIVQALIVSRLTYHLPYHNLTLTQTEKMDILLRTAVKAALGLPPHASTRRLCQLRFHNTITELLEAQYSSQLQRLRPTRQGCAILSRLGYPIREKPHTVAPIPRNMKPHRHAGRRRARVQAMTRIFGDGTSDLQVLYTDAARYREKPAMCLAVIDNTDALVAPATLRTTDSGSAEEGAIDLAIDAPVPIVTDSQAACRAFVQRLVAAHTLSSVSPSTLRTVRIVSSPGHASLHTNERVHVLARGLTSRAPSEELSNPDDAPTEPLNCNAMLEYYRQSRYMYPPPHPSLNRADAVARRQLQTD